jgi:hypothetical protein
MEYTVLGVMRANTWTHIAVTVSENGTLTVCVDGQSYIDYIFVAILTDSCYRSGTDSQYGSCSPLHRSVVGYKVIVMPY